jgi:pimeloyl-ACP methyl ester carboxylesterase
MPLWKRLLRLVVITILTLVFFLLGWQSKLIYHPQANRAEHEALLRAASGVRLRFSTSQGEQTAYYIPPRTAAPSLPDTLWLCFAGNASLALDWLQFTGDWDARFAYLLVDYPSYGECAGTPTPERIRESGTAAVAALVQHLHTTQAALQPHLAVLGHSLGCAAALMAADDLDVRRGVLLSPFTTMTEMGRIVLGWPLCYLNQHRFDNRRPLGRIAARAGARFVIFHGTEDEVIPLRMGRELAAAHPQAVTLHEVPRGHHSDLLDLVSPEIGQAMDEVVAGAGKVD